jgi:hypothetical protein
MQSTLHFLLVLWLIEKAKWSYLAVSRQLARLIVRCFPRREWNLVIDDFICPRNSKEAPEVKYYKEHSTKPNRPKYICLQATKFYFIKV